RTLWQGCQGEIAEDRGGRDQATAPVARGQLCLRVPPSIMEIRDILAARNPLTFPQHIATHSTEQIFYFDQQGLLSSFRSAGGMSRLTDSNRSSPCRGVCDIRFEIAILSADTQHDRLAYWRSDRQRQGISRSQRRRYRCHVADATRTALALPDRRQERGEAA